MGILNRILGRETRSARIKSSDPYLAEYFGIRDSASGVTVTPYLAENISVVAACVQIISETVAMLPCVVYRKLNDSGREAESNHPVARILTGDANDNLTASEFIELMTAHCLLRGNAFAEIIRDRRGAPVQLVPHHPDCVSVVRLNLNNRIAFDVTDQSDHQPMASLPPHIPASQDVCGGPIASGRGNAKPSPPARHHLRASSLGFAIFLWIRSVVGGLRLGR